MTREDPRVCVRIKKGQSFRYRPLPLGRMIFSALQNSIGRPLESIGVVYFARGRDRDGPFCKPGSTSLTTCTPPNPWYHYRSSREYSAKDIAILRYRGLKADGTLTDPAGEVIEVLHAVWAVDFRDTESKVHGFFVDGKTHRYTLLRHTSSLEVRLPYTEPDELASLQESFLQSLETWKSRLVK